MSGEQAIRIVRQLMDRAEPDTAEQIIHWDVSRRQGLSGTVTWSDGLPTDIDVQICTYDDNGLVSMASIDGEAIINQFKTYRL